MGKGSIAVGSEKEQGDGRGCEVQEVDLVPGTQRFGFPEKLYILRNYLKKKSLFLTLHLITFLVLRRRRFFRTENSLTGYIRENVKKAYFQKLRIQLERSHLNFSRLEACVLTYLVFHSSDEGYSIFLFDTV